MLTYRSKCKLKGLWRVDLKTRPRTSPVSVLRLCTTCRKGTNPGVKNGPLDLTYGGLFTDCVEVGKRLVGVVPIVETFSILLRDTLPWVTTYRRVDFRWTFVILWDIENDRSSTVARVSQKKENCLGRRRNWEETDQEPPSERVGSTSESGKPGEIN